jgi:hypothetical protein
MYATFGIGYEPRFPRRSTQLVNIALIVAGSLSILGAAIHGGAGEVLVVRKLSPGTLPATRFGGPGMTRAMIHVTWHMATIGLLIVGCALILAGSVLDGDAARDVALVAAAGSTGFAALALALGGSAQPLRSVVRHPGPAVLTATAALAWLGAL